MDANYFSPAPDVNVVGTLNRMSPRPDGTFIFGAWTNNNTSEQWLFVVDPDGSIAPEISLGAPAATFLGAAATTDPSGNILIDEHGSLTKRAEPAAAPLWETDFDVDSPGPSQVRTDAAGNTFVMYYDDGCSAGATICLRKFSPDGDVLWTHGVSGSGYPTFDVRPSGESVAVTSAMPTAEFIDQNGVLTATQEISTNPDIRARAISFGGHDNGIVVVGDLNLAPRIGFDYRAWAIQASPETGVEWEQVYSIGGDANLTGVVVTDDGRLYVTGLRDYFNNVLIGYFGTGIVAELAL